MYIIHNTCLFINEKVWVFSEAVLMIIMPQSFCHNTMVRLSYFRIVPDMPRLSILQVLR